MSRTLSKLSVGTVAALMACTGWMAAAQSDAVRIKPGTKVMLDLDSPLNTATARVEDVVWFTVRSDLRVDGLVALPRGTPVRGSVISVKPAVVNGKNQRTEIQVRLEEIPLAEGGALAVVADVLKVQGEKANGGASAGQVAVGSASQGAMLGGMITRSAKGAGIGAAAAIGVTVLSSVLKSPGPSSDVDLPGGSIFEAKLERALEISDPAMLAKAVPKAPVAPAPDAPLVAANDRAIAVSASVKTTADAGDTPSPAAPAFDPVPVGEATPSADKGIAADSGASASVSVSTIRPASLSVDVNLVQVDAVVRDRAGKPLGNLRQEDFRLFEDGVEQRIQFFSRDQLPLAVALVIDRSGSVAPLMSAVQTAAYQALQLLKAGDEVCLFTFDGNVELLEELTSNRQRVANRIGSIHAGGGTAIVDGVSEALRYLDATAHDRRRAVILISDNVEGRSTANVGQTVEFALESEAVVYSVKVGNSAGSLFGLPGLPGLPMPGIPGLGPNDPVKAITKETGGEIFDATGGGSIGGALTTAVDRLKLRYTMSYSPANSAAERMAKGGYHRIQVQLVSRFGKPDTDYSIHARSGYYDPALKTKAAAATP